MPVSGTVTRIDIESNGGAGAVAGSELPSATLTFLFTDLQDSSRTWEQHGAAMERALLRHDERITEAVERLGGHIFYHRGDGLAAAFQSAFAAVSAARNIQLELATANDEGPRLRVRIGVHTGEAAERNGNFFGPVMNRVGRILDAAHGGQVLLSGVTAELVADRLPEGCALRDLGRHQFRGMSRAEHLHQLLHPALEDGFPPPRTNDGGSMPSGTVAVAFTDMVGSTRRNFEVGDVSHASIVEEHSRIVHESVDRHGGVVVKSMGDGFMLAFHRADDAVSALQEVMERSREAENALRAGIHVGTPIRVGDDYVGRDVSLANHIASAAGPGELLVSDAARLLAVPGAWELGPPREVLIPGLEQVVQAYAVRSEARPNRQPHSRRFGTACACGTSAPRAMWSNSPHDR